MTHHRLWISGSVVAALLFTGPALAQGQPGADEVNRLINELDRRPASTDAYRTNIRKRTLQVRPDIARQDIYVTNAAIQEIPVVLNYNHSEDFTINFRFDSFQLTRDARDTLDLLGEALNSAQLRDDRFIVAGHTDTVGKDDYNQWLSERRAYEVTAYLVSAWNIAPDRLQPVGFGETELKDARKGANRINRRVEFTIIEPESGQAPIAAGPAAGSTAASTTAASPTAAPGTSIYANVPAHPIGTTSAPLAGAGDPSSAASAPAVPSQRAAAPAQPGANGQNVVCDTPGAGLSDPRPSHSSLDDFGSGRTPAPCIDTAQRRAVQQPVQPQPGAAQQLGGTNSAIDDVNNAIGN